MKKHNISKKQTISNSTINRIMHTMKDHRSYHGETEIIEPKSGESYERNHRKRGNKPKPDKNETQYKKKSYVCER